MKRLYLAYAAFLLFFLITSAAFAGETETALYIANMQPAQGDCFVVYLSGVPQEAAPVVQWTNKTIPFFWTECGWRAIVPVWVEVEPGPQTVAISWKDTECSDTQRLEASVLVRKREFGTQNFVVKPEIRKIYDFRELEKENRIIRKIHAQFSPQQLWEGQFAPPITGIESTPYATIRYYCDRRLGHHKGTDIAVPMGTPVPAPNHGVVVLAHDFPLHGKSIIIDHGQGVFTVYFHYSEILVKQGQQVKKGDIIGLVGSTGISTGPHLHYALYVAGVCVDPAWWEAAAR